MADESAFGWTDPETPWTAEDPTDPPSDPGIDFDAILRRLDGSRSQTGASTRTTLPNLIPASAPVGSVAGVVSPSGEPSVGPASETSEERQSSGPIEIAPPPNPVMIRANTTAEVADPGRPALRASVDLPRWSGEAPETPSSQPGRDGVAGQGGASLPGARATATAIPPPIGPLRLQPPAVDLGLGSSARPEAQPGPTSTVPGGGRRYGEDLAFAGSRQGVSPEDLLKTNELLRQLVEETRRLRVASLPAASPSAYPAR